MSAQDTQSPARPQEKAVAGTPPAGPLALWRRWTEPTSDGGLSRRREAVLFSVLAGLVVIAGLTFAVRLSGVSFEHGTGDAWLPAADVAAGASFAGLLLLARRGHHRPASLALVAILGALAVALLLRGGAGEPTWAVLLLFALVLAALLLGGRAAAAGLATSVVGVLAIIAARDGTGLLRPAVEVLILIGFLVFLCWLYTRDAQAPAAGKSVHGTPRAPALVLVPPLPPERTARTEELSLREVEVVRLVAEGLSNGAIAGALFVSPRTVQTHLANAMRKCDCANRTELGVLAVREGLAPLQVATSAGSSSRS